MSDIEKQEVLHYAELEFKKQREQLSEDEKQEMEKIRAKLEMEHQAILDLAKQKLYPEE